MAGSGKAKYLAGLQSLVQGFQAMDERRRQRLLDNLEREKFEYEKSLDAGAAQDRRENRILGIREKQFDRMIDMGKLRQGEENMQENRAGRVLGARDKIQQRMLELGRLRAQEEGLGLSRETLGISQAREARLASSPAATGIPKRTPFDVLRDVEETAQQIAARDRQMPIVSPSARAEATKYVTGAGDLPMPKAEAAQSTDPYTEMSQDEWEDYVSAQVRRYAGYDQARIKTLAADPAIITIMDADPSDRRILSKDIPNLVGR